MNSLSRIKEDIDIDDILSKAKDYIEDEEQLSIIEKAYQFALKKHEGQFRKTGEDYISHPLNVSFILTSIYADYETISAGLLHDVLEECDCTIDELEEKFGKNISDFLESSTII